MQNQLLLLEDVESLGRSGDLVSVKPGYARNFLLPQKVAVVADKYTLRLRARLQEERTKKAVVDKKESELLAAKLATLDLSIEVKVDADGRMYGSVTAADIMKISSVDGTSLEKKNIILPHPIKTLGIHKIKLKLKEDVPAVLKIEIYGDRAGRIVEEEVAEEASTEENVDA